MREEVLDTEVARLGHQLAVRRGAGKPCSLEWRSADFWSKIDGLFMDIGQGYICINPEANRVITHFLSDNFTDYFETVADTADWNYPEWYLDGSPL